MYTTFEVIAITETFLKPNDSDYHLQLPGFNFFRQDRLGKEGSGVALYIREHWKVSLIAQYDPKYDNIPEYMIAKLKHTKNNIIIAVVYRRPHAAAPFEFFEKLSNFLTSHTKIIITGDFNADLQSTQLADTRTLKDIIKTHALSFVSFAPTHHLLHENHQSHTTLDLFITRKTQSLTSFSQSESPFIAGHDFIELSIPYRTPRPPPRTITSRCLSKMPAGQILTALLPKLQPLSNNLALS